MNYIKILSLSILLLSMLACSKENNNSQEEAKTNDKKIGVLVVSHGSHSPKWREMLTSLGESATADILKNQSIKGVKSAFMEYTEPSIATRMKEFDKEGYTDVIIVPMLLTVSGHSFDDIPHILGQKNTPAEIEKLKQEKIEIYKAKANIHMTPLLDFQKS